MGTESKLKTIGSQRRQTSEAVSLSLERARLLFESKRAKRAGVFCIYRGKIRAQYGSVLDYIRVVRGVRQTPMSY